MPFFNRHKNSNTLFVRVVTHDLKNSNNAPTEEVIALNHEGRSWLARHAIWCYNNHRSLETFNEDDNALSLAPETVPLN